MAVTENAGGDRRPPATVAELAARARRERGRVSVYGHEGDVARALAERAGAAPLYTGLSTDFVDLEKMIAKLARERDRRWFIEVNTEGGTSALISVAGDLCHVVVAGAGGQRSAAGGPASGDNSLLGELIDECGGAGCVFDVYFKRADEGERLPDSHATEREAEAAESPAQAVGEPEAVSSSDAGPGHSPAASPQAASSQAASSQADGAHDSTPDQAAGGGPSQEPGAGAVPPAPPERQAGGGLEDAADAEALVEVKRLMGEVAKTIEEAAQAVEQRAIFPMYLRTSQLKIADRYPFLDPFGAEFEYLAGEIAFIGKASPADFIAGLTEALSLAVVSVIQSSTQPARMRARVAEDLERLSARLGPELERFGLDRSVEQIMSV
jgi:hypothetical protein